MTNAKQIIELMTLKTESETVFIGENYVSPWGRIFGGQVLGQSLYAAYQTIPENYLAHSMHAYFILGGDPNIPVKYEVQKIRTGRSFMTRRVVAYQKNVPIFNMSASFHKEEEGIDHQFNFPENTPEPEDLKNSLEQIELLENKDSKLYKVVKHTYQNAFEFKPTTNLINLLEKNSNHPVNKAWFRLNSGKDIEIDKRMNHVLLSYISDYSLLLTASLPHREKINISKTFTASLDHALWFHRNFDIRDYMLYVTDSPSASHARGFARGSIYSRNKRLVASVAQEGILRATN